MNEDNHIFIPEDLISQIIKGEAVVFAGAGLSQGAGLPGWIQLMRHMLDWGEKNAVPLKDRKEFDEMIKKGELLDTAEEIRERLGKSAFQEIVRQTFNSTDSISTEVHRILTQIPFSAILTGNYDTLLESVYPQIQNRVFTHADFPELSRALRAGEFYLLKMFGTVNQIKTVVLGTHDYQSVLSHEPAYRQYLSSLFAQKTILFLGVAPNDPDLQLLLTEFRSTFRDRKGNHYALVDTEKISELEQNRFQKNYHIQILPYSPSLPDHLAVLRFLKDLNEKVKERTADFLPEKNLGVSSFQQLTQEVSTWLQVLRYELKEEIQRDERTWEVKASLDQGTVQQKVLVRCIDGEIRKSDVESLDDVLTRNLPQGWLISDKRVSLLAKKIEKRGEELFTLAEFLEKKVWKNYFEQLRTIVEEKKIPQKNVDLACYRLEVDDIGREREGEKLASLEKYIDDWLKEPEKIHISLLGEFGSGKTWFCRHYAYRQLQRYLKDPVNERLPLLITLREFPRSTTYRVLINDALLGQYKLPFLGNPFELFLKMSRSGKFLLILDGFDEMVCQVDYQTVVENFWELAKLAETNSKVILTSRSKHFRWGKESPKILGGGKEEGTIELSPPQFEVFHLQSFDEDQIYQFIVNHLGKENGEQTAERVLKNPNLAEMSQKPVLIELLLAAMEEVNSGLLTSQAQVYLYATNRFLLKRIDSQQIFTSTGDKLFFLCELAWEMISKQELRIHYKDIPQRILRYFKKEKRLEMDHWEFNLRNQDLLYRSGSGYYEFTHKSLAEYFVALKFAEELGCLSEEFRRVYRDKQSGPCQIPYQKLTVEKLSYTFGFFPIASGHAGDFLNTVTVFLRKMMSPEAEKSLWVLLKQTRGKDEEHVRFVGGNIAMLLKHWFGSSFEGAELSGAVLKNSTFFYSTLAGNIQSNGINLNKTNLRGAILSEVYFGASTFEEVDLQNAVLRKVYFGTPSVSSLLWNHETLIGSLLDGSIRCWNILTGEEKILLGGLENEVCSMLLLKEGKELIIGDCRKTVIHWNWDSPREIRRIKNPHPVFHQMSLSPDEKTLACVDHFDKIALFEIETGKLLHTFELHEEEPHTPRFLCTAFVHQEGEKLIGAGSSNEIVVWSIPEKVLVKKWESGLQEISKICYNPTLKRVLVEGRVMKESHQWSGMVECWDWEKNELLFSIENQSEGKSSIACSTKGDRFVAPMEEGKIGLFNFDSGTPLHVFDSEETSLPPRCLAFSPDDRFLAVGRSTSNCIRIWDIDPQSERFGQCILIFDLRLNFRGMKIAGAKGLEQKLNRTALTQHYEGTLLEYFAEGGAILDEEQQHTWKERQLMRKPEERKKYLGE